MKISVQFILAFYQINHLITLIKENYVSAALKIRHILMGIKQILGIVPFVTLNRRIFTEDFLLFLAAVVGALTLRGQLPKLAGQLPNITHYKLL